MKKLKKVLILLLMAVVLCGSSMTVWADENDSDNDSSADSPSDQYASDAWKDQIRGQLNRYYSDLKILYKLTDEQIKRMDRIYNSAMTYMKNAGLTMSELTSYEASVEGYLAEIAKETPPSGTEKFLMLS
ncbi:MAG: hypothetical protein K2O99_00385, partial [Lachnospiraceae bacterium]|nr:hypothetical protein [Lachnospiraceae bacterium]